MRLCALTTPSRFLSINADAIRAIMLIICPIPICLIGVRVRPVRFLYLRSMKRSIMKMEMAVAKRLNTMIEAAGILKCGPRCLSMVRAWSTVRLLKMPIGVLRKMPVDHSGMIFIRALRSSTSLTVHSVHEFPCEPSNCFTCSIFKAAQLRNLKEKNLSILKCAKENQIFA